MNGRIGGVALIGGGRAKGVLGLDCRVWSGEAVWFGGESRDLDRVAVIDRAGDGGVWGIGVLIFPGVLPSQRRTVQGHGIFIRIN